MTGLGDGIGRPRRIKPRSELWRIRTGNVDNLKARSTVGEVNVSTRHDHSSGESAGINSTGAEGICRITDVDHLQSIQAGGEVSTVALNRHRIRPREGAVTAHPPWASRVLQANDAKAGNSIDHICVIALDRDRDGLPGRLVAAQSFGNRRIADIQN